MLNDNSFYTNVLLTSISSSLVPFVENFMLLKRTGFFIYHQLALARGNLHAVFMPISSPFFIRFEEMFIYCFV